jgi:cytochrome c-type biogenesis protein CcmF
MIPELGHVALILALLLALLLGALALLGAQRAQPRWMALAVPLAVGQSLFVFIAWGCLVHAFVHDDFSVRNVAENSNSLLPLAYRAAAAWGSHEGSMLLWVVMQAVWMLAVAASGRHLPSATLARVLGVMGLVSAAFALFVLATSNPFLRVFPIPLQGRDLNPLLQDPGMALHPPLLYMGYVGFSVAFAFATAALLSERPDPAWAGRSRRWTAAAWCFLTAGVAVGSWWAYTELGWGGWWFWDPVENAALMPWLVGTALLHALAVADRRGQFQAWTVLLAITCFTLSLLGTFLVRSGVLASVHAFAIDPRRGIFILGLLLLVVGGSLTLFALRAGRFVRPAAPAALLSREALMLIQGALLTVAAASVLLGTLYPLLIDALGLGKLSVGAPYFEAVFAPLMVPLVFLLGLGPLLRWQEPAAASGLWRRLRWVLAAAALAALGLAWWWGGDSLRLLLWLFLAAWAALALVLAVHERARRSPLGPWRGLARQGPGWWGMVLAHAGVAVFVIGVTVVRTFETESEVAIAPGQTVPVGGAVLAFVGVAPVPGPNYRSERGSFELRQDGRVVAMLHPEKRRYLSLPGTAMTEAGIASSWRGDVYVALGEALGDGAWSVRVQHKPGVTWIWGGCALMSLGGLLAALGRSSRSPHRKLT